MNNNIDNFIEKSLEQLDKTANLTQEQKDSMLKNVLIKANTDQDTAKTFKSMVFMYPWRFALGVSVIQAVVFTVAFGSNYTNLVFKLIGR